MPPSYADWWQQQQLPSSLFSRRSAVCGQLRNAWYLLLEYVHTQNHARIFIRKHNRLHSLTFNMPDVVIARYIRSYDHSDLLDFLDEHQGRAERFGEEDPSPFSCAFSSTYAPAPK